MAPGEKSSLPGLVVVGSYNTDLIIWCDRIPSRGETLMGGNSEMFCGGRGANCAVAAAPAGCEVMFVGAHGPDSFGKMALNRLEHEGIDISNFVELPYSKTGLCLVFHERRAGVHAALVANSANNQFPASLVRKAEAAIREADLIFTVFEIGNEALLEVFRLCQHWHKRLVVHASPVDGSTILPSGNYFLLVLDDFEALALTCQDNLEAAVLELHGRGAGATGALPLRLTFALVDRDFDQAAQLIEKMKGSEDNGFAYAHRPVPVECYRVLMSRLRDEPLRAGGPLAEARQQLNLLVLKSPQDAGLLSQLAVVDALLNNFDIAISEAKRACEMLPVPKDAVDGPGLLINLAVVYAWTNNLDLAFATLGPLTRMPLGIYYGQLKRDPYWEPLRQDPRYEKLLAQLAATD